MKHFLSALTVMAAAGAVVGAAGYYVYKKTKEAKEYEDLMYTDEMGEDFVIYEEDMEDDTAKYAEVVADVKDTVVSAAENVKDTVVDAFTDVKEAIEGAIEK